MLITVVIECKDCKHCTKDWIGHEDGYCHRGDGWRYWCHLYNRMVYEDDTCRNAEEK